LRFEIGREASTNSKSAVQPSSAVASDWSRRRRSPPIIYPRLETVGALSEPASAPATVATSLQK
jgi:hypothetical protein